MKEHISEIKKKFIYVLTGVQVIFFLLWLVLWILSGEFGGFKGVLGLLCMVGITVFAFMIFVKDKKKRLIGIIYFITLPVVIHTALSGSNYFGCPAKPVGNMKELAIQRITWPYFCEIGYSYELETEDKQGFFDVAVSPSSVFDTFLPDVYAHYDEETAEVVLENLIKAAFDMHKKDIAIEWSKDIACYLTAPYVDLFLLTKADSLNHANNLFDFYKAGGKLPVVYFRFSMLGFFLLSLITVLEKIVLKEKISFRKLLIPVGLIILISLYCSYFTLRGFDYKNSVWILMIYTLWIFGKGNKCSF